ncbi:MAG: Chaperone protein DnaK, partial [Parcubacteria group bacterium GW2011_GWA2_47_10]
IETLGGVMTRLIEKNTTVPTAKSQIFSTASDSQTTVEIHVLQGEREFAGDNKTLARFILDGIPPSPRGIPQIEVTFDIDANGVLSVKAKDKATAKEQSVRIEASSGLSKEEIEKMKKDAELHAEEDKKRKEIIEAKNIADQMIYTAEKALRDAGDKVPAEARKEIEDKVNDLKNVKEGADLASIKNASQSLAQATQKVGEILYKAAGEKGAGGEQAGDGGQSGGTDGKKDGNIKEAEFEDK